MGKIMTAEQVVERNRAAAQRIFNKCVAFAKKHGIHLGHCDLTPMGAEWVLSMNCSEKMASNAADIILEDNRTTVTFEHDYPGVYDWQSRTYIEDCSVVKFKFS